MIVLRSMALALTALLGGCAHQAEVPAPATRTKLVAVEVVTVPATASRQTTITIYSPARPRGALLFSHGASGTHGAYLQLISRLTAAGYAVLAPLHVDSRQHPDRARYTLQTSFMERVADVGAAAKLAQDRYPALPMAAMGHSFGALFAQMQGGALSAFSSRVPGLKAVVSFSSPGIIRGLVDPATAFTSIAVPTLMITGTADVVPGFTSDWNDHMASHRGAPAGDRYALVLQGGDHFVAAASNPAHFERAAEAAIAFLDAYVLGERAARRRLAGVGGLERR